MEPNLRFSVVIPTRNRADKLTRAIASVLQAPEASEIIVSDNASTDDTQAVVHDLQVQNRERIRSIRSDSDIGMVGNWKQGLSHARGDWILLLCDDDWIEPDLFKNAHSLIQSHSDLALCAVERIEIPDRPSPHSKNIRKSFRGNASRLNEKELLIQFVCHENVLGPPSSVLIRKTALENAMQSGELFSPVFRYAADWAAWFTLARQGDIGLIRKPLVYFEIHESNLTHRAVAEGTDLVEVSMLRWLSLKRLKSLGVPTLPLTLFLHFSIAYRVLRRLMRLTLRGHPLAIVPLISKLLLARREALNLE